MIDARDLQIGNYFNVAIDDQFNNEIVRIVAYDHTTKEIGVQFADGDVEHYLGVELFSPIKITPEWLGKLGLEEDDHCDYSHWLTSNYQVLVETSPDGTGFCILDEHSDYAFTKKINYVHEIQNLIYTLTKQELALNSTGGEA